ncbi:MAG: hypothetical protein ACYTG6_17890, partial [Planctomycetota bacterium]
MVTSHRKRTVSKARVEFEIFNQYRRESDFEVYAHDGEATFTLLFGGPIDRLSFEKDSKEVKGKPWSVKVRVK